MEKSKNYKAFFNSRTLRQAWEGLVQKAGQKLPSTPQTLQVKDTGATWKFDTVDEFLAAYRPDIAMADFDHIMKGGYRFILDFDAYLSCTNISIEAPSRPEIEAIFNIFEDVLPDSLLATIEPPVEKPVIFIGHGRSGAWRDLKDHLRDKHEYEVSAYEIGSRAGHAIRDILEEMLDESSCAFLVLTGEDEMADGRLLARQNVVHETGLFQGRLGFSRAIVLLEDGAEEFSNLEGIQQIRFAKSNIKETFGEVLAVLRREFGPQ
jgi:predicted nucleotide-binding protein